MTNRLKMAEIHAIDQLHSLHWSQRRIARELGIDRGTVGRHLRRRLCRANAAISITGSPPPNAATLDDSPGPGRTVIDNTGGPACVAEPNAAISITGSTTLNPGLNQVASASQPSLIEVSG
jgi:hypothetical protein